MTMDDLAAEAGISRRSISLHSPSEEEVAVASFDRVVALEEKLRELARRSGPLDSWSMWVKSQGGPTARMAGGHLPGDEMGPRS